METKKKHVVRDYFITVLNGMAWGLFSSLLIGLIIKQLGILTGIDQLVVFGNVAQRMMGPAIGVGVAYALKAQPLVIMSCVAVGALGAGSLSFDGAVATIGIGEPVGAFAAVLIAAEAGKRISGKTKVDIVLVPLTTILVGGAAALLISPIMTRFMTTVGALINTATELQPLPMGIIISIVMGMVLTLPISSAALAISLGLSGLAAGAATVGCAANMIGFAVASYKDNGIGGALAQGLGTSMLQIPNIIKKPVIWLPAIIASALLGPVSTLVFKMTSNASGAGMGTSGLVGQFAMTEVMGTSPQILFQMALMHFILPGIIAGITAHIMRRRGIIKDGDMKLEEVKK